MGSPFISLPCSRRTFSWDGHDAHTNQGDNSPGRHVNDMLSEMQRGLQSLSNSLSTNAFHHDLILHQHRWSSIIFPWLWSACVLDSPAVIPTFWSALSSQLDSAAIILQQDVANAIDAAWHETREGMRRLDIISPHWSITCKEIGNIYVNRSLLTQDMAT